jgi:hypothetical protein
MVPRSTSSRGGSQHRADGCPGAAHHGVAAAGAVAGYVSPPMERWFVGATLWAALQFVRLCMALESINAQVLKRTLNQSTEDWYSTIHQHLSGTGSPGSTCTNVVWFDLGYLPASAVASCWLMHHRQHVSRARASEHPVASPPRHLISDWQCPPARPKPGGLGLYRASTQQ